MMFKISIIVLLPIIVLLAVFPVQVFGQEPEITDIEWLTYTDPRFDFTIEYPANWTIKPRTDALGALSEVLTFRSPLSDNGQVYSIAIGQYLYKIWATDSLSEWTDWYNQMAGDFPDHLKTSIRKNVQIDNSEALFIRGVSPLTEFQYTNIRRGETVWFIWSNIGDSADEVYAEIYDHMLNSLKFGPQSPLSLRDISLSKFSNVPANLPDTGADQGSLGFLVWIGGGVVLIIVGGHIGWSFLTSLLMT